MARLGVVDCFVGGKNTQAKTMRANGEVNLHHNLNGFLMPYDREDDVNLLILHLIQCANRLFLVHAFIDKEELLKKRKRGDRSNTAPRAIFSDLKKDEIGRKSIVMPLGELAGPLGQPTKPVRAQHTWLKGKLNVTEVTNYGDNPSCPPKSDEVNKLATKVDIKYLDTLVRLADKFIAAQVASVVESMVLKLSS